MKSTFQESVYYYHPTAADIPAAMKLTLARLGIRMHRILPDQIGETLGFLVHLEGFDPQTEIKNTPSIPEEVLILHNFSSERLNVFLRALKKAGIPPIPLKAMVTQHNVKWTFSALVEELRQEHEAMTQRRTKEKESH